MVFIRHGGTGEPRLAEKFVVKVRLCFHIFRMPQSIFGISIWVAQAIRRTKCEQRFELMGGGLFAELLSTSPFGESSGDAADDYRRGGVGTTPPKCCRPLLG